MCGIIACIGHDDSVNRVVAGLENLEYRGYDSAGIAVKEGSDIAICKQSGQISELKNSIVDSVPQSDIGIGHTRWSTHGPPTDENAHPHTAETERVAVVHNGIVENYDELRTEMRARGRRFSSETDTEVVPHLIESRLENGSSPQTAFLEAIGELEGSYAIAAVIEGSDTVFATRQDSPLVLGRGNDEFYLASDVPAFLQYTNRVQYLDDGDVVEVSPEGATITGPDGCERSPPVETVNWDADETGKGQYDHYMMKEIDNQPTALDKTIRGRVDSSAPAVELDELQDGQLSAVSTVHLVGCGTSYHAARYGSTLMNQRGISSRAFRANEYTDVVPVDDETLVVAVTQSGETADTLEALRLAEANGAQTIAMTNVIESSAAREADTPLYIRAGPEIGVAATKTFSSQVLLLALLSEYAAAEIPGARQREDMAAFLRAVERVPDDVETLLRTSGAESVSRNNADRDSYFFIGHELEYPVALEGALKFKEITYEHAEGYPSGELKHGPLALVTPETTIFALFTGDGNDQTRSNAKEAQTRGATVVAVTDEETETQEFADQRLTIPETHPDLAGLLGNVQLQLVSYHTAHQLERPIDKPRNLAKSVTVK